MKYNLFLKGRNPILKNWFRAFHELYQEITKTIKCQARAVKTRSRDRANLNITWSSHPIAASVDKQWNKWCSRSWTASIYDSALDRGICMYCKRILRRMIWKISNSLNIIIGWCVIGALVSGDDNIKKKEDCYCMMGNGTNWKDEQYRKNLMLYLDKSLNTVETFFYMKVLRFVSIVAMVEK